MPSIQILSETLINKIAAGEVVERPASVVKELVENAIDAGGDQIFVTVDNGGKTFISVLDNGKGMSEEDANLSIERHATSKISTNQDLENISTMGFRGEALAAISAVSRFELTTCGDEIAGGYQLRMEGGKIIHTARMGFPQGTRIVVEDLFFNTPARQKFMKSANTEFGHIHDLIVRLALGNPHIQFRLTHNKNLILNIPKETDYRNRIAHCFGNEVAESLIECSHEESYLSFNGFISDPTRSRQSKRWQHTFVNGRYVKCQTINHGIYEGYKTLLMKGLHPMFFMHLNLSPSEVDVNVHPAKTEIRLKNANLVHTIFSSQVSKLLKLQDRSTMLTRSQPPITEDKEVQAPKPDQKETREPAKNDPVLFTGVDDQLGFETEAPSRKDENASASDQTFLKTDPEETQLDQDPFAFTPAVGLKQAVDVPLDEPSSDLPLTVLGQFQTKYIVAQGENKLILIDQHAAHERIRFEEIKQQFFDQQIQTQPLLVPVMIELPPQDGLLLEQYQESWTKLGFTIDHFGGNDYSVKEIPMILKDSDIGAVIKDVLDEMSQFGKSGKLETFFNEVFEKMACHSAIRAAQPLSREEMVALVKQLVKYDISLHCPHGRPVWIEFSLEELDRRFKRT